MTRPLVLLFLSISPSLHPSISQEDSLKSLFTSLSDDQKKAALKSCDDPNRDAEVFTPGDRPGLLIAKLSGDQLKLLDDAVRAFLSADGYAQAMKVATQSHKKEGLKAYWLNFFGDPSKDKSWVFRVSEHHFTLVHVTGDPARFGPILLGANPPDLWHDQEDPAIACFKKLTDDEKKRARAGDSSESGRPLGAKGVAIGDLSDDARKAAAAMIDARLALFSETQQKKLRAILEAEGGVAKLRLAFFGDMTKRCADGGRADWKIEGRSFLCDYESSRAHIHMTLRGAAEKK